MKIFKKQKDLSPEELKEEQDKLDKGLKTAGGALVLTGIPMSVLGYLAEKGKLPKDGYEQYIKTTKRAGIANSLVGSSLLGYNVYRKRKKSLDNKKETEGESKKSEKGSKEKNDD